MIYTPEETIQYVAEEDVKFIRLAFTDVFGTQKNISVMPGELERAFKYGIAIDASAIAGFGGVVHSDLFLHPDPSTLAILPWRPEHGRVVRMFCTITYPDGREFAPDTRSLLKRAVELAEAEGYSFYIGSETEFYLFNRDENGEPTSVPYDRAGYMDIAPADKGENVRREICLDLERMGIIPESSHHAEGPGQNEIDFRRSDPLTAADNAVTFRSVVSTIAARNGLYADFSPKPIKNRPGNGFHIKISVANNARGELLPRVIAGILKRIPDMTLFLNTSDESYLRLGANKAPKYITWSSENRSQLIRIPAPTGDSDDLRAAELRSPDPLANPYLAFALLILAGLEGLKDDAVLPLPADIDLYTADEQTLSGFKTLPHDFEEAVRAARSSDFINKYLPAQITDCYCAKR